MQALPIIVGFGGYNAAGRSSSHQGFRRTVVESLSPVERNKTLVGLACLMGLVRWDGSSYRDQSGQSYDAAAVASTFADQVMAGTLIRRLENAIYNPEEITGHKRVKMQQHDEGGVRFTLSRRDMPAQIPGHWNVRPLEDGSFEIHSRDTGEFLVPVQTEQLAKAAGQLPSGFDPAAQYSSRFHPRGLQLALLGASDAIHSVGVPWEQIVAAVHPDEIGVYGSSVFGQLAPEGFGGLLQSRLRSERTSSKQLALGLNTMPADFINAYVLGSVGHTEAITGACASFLYVLQAAVRDIRSGRRRVAVVGNAEASLTPEIFEGFTNMGALGTDEGLCKLDGSSLPDWRRASRPFGENCGFTLAEGAQFVVLMDDALAVELGADIHGAVPEVFINADGLKKSISAPGAGNYVSFAKAVASAVAILGEDTVKHNSFIHAHGSSTPANRITESEIFNRVAAAFGISDWPVAAVKAYVGHTIASASGDQLMSALGTFKYQLIPGIKTIDRVAADVCQTHTSFPLQDRDVKERGMDLALINSKGFGGNNATAVVISPRKVEDMLSRRYGAAMTDYRSRLEQTRQRATDYELRADRAELDVIYRFGEQVIDDSAIQFSRDGLTMPGFANAVIFDKSNPWADMS
ncbi:MAG: beta-ketoacyl synthase [Porticoccus sp.]|jgi:acetoacetyl-[acyl-carrier protein] synthase|uniref:beta-ketoacyl synthase n=1 Tax=Porticoccus hydrocarbonoclasticus TaxID=1073414 RepID=UPI000C54F1D0|nr:beta-ketoacyl synthase [Porticoccus hydrocarbonoclasticus]MBG56897.1 beta-ketoacyl synthase [Porticoccus sp.]|tara:strand:+ start:2110 stop:4011 length:1902 start_codon:yes stop_codon:yes gene_type:complete